MLQLTVPTTGTHPHSAHWSNRHVKDAMVKEGSFGNKGSSVTSWAKLIKVSISHTENSRIVRLCPSH